MSQKEVTEIFRALGDSTRVKLVKLLLEKNNICVSELATEIDISVAGVSQQLKLLEQAHIIERVRDGQKICYQIDKSDPRIMKLLKILQTSS